MPGTLSGLAGQFRFAFGELRNFAPVGRSVTAFHFFASFAFFVVYLISGNFWELLGDAGNFWEKTTFEQRFA